MIKIAHMSDIHFRGLTRHAEYKKSFEDAFQKLRKLKPDVILIAGDIVHSKTQGISPELIDILTWWFRSLGDIADTRVTLGNHDGLILNSDREDAISPIIRAIDHPNIQLYKKSGTYKLKDNYNLCVFSCFDEEGWKDVVPVKDEVNIATFHGPISGCVTDEDWAIDGETTVDFFDQFDCTLLGDIHKFQYLDREKRIAYSGSVVQQNYGESLDKGFLFWTIEDRDDFSSRFVKVKNDYPFVTLDYLGNIDKLLSEAEMFPLTSRFRIRIFDHLNQGEISQIKGAIKSKFKPTEIVIKQEKIIDTNSIDIEKDVLIETFDDVKNLIFDYHSTSSLSEKIKDTMSQYLKEAWESSDIEDTHKGGKYHIKKMEFDNAFGYGENNVVNFDSAVGITGIFGKNRSGKSSICGALAYGLFNGSDRAALKNLHIINVRKNYCNVKISFSKSGVDYLLERQSVKVTNKKGETWAPTNLNLFEIDSETGIKKDMSEEQRRETEKILRDLVGNIDDFLLTSLSSQGNVNKFIDLNGAARKSNLAKFLRLDIFDKLNDSLKDELNSTKKLLDLVPEKQFDESIGELEKKIASKIDDRKKNNEKIDNLKIDLEELQKSLTTDSSEKYTKLEIKDQNSVITTLKERKVDIQNNLTSSNTKLEETKNKKNEIEVEISKIDQISLISKKDERDLLNKQSLSIERKFDKKKEEIERDKNEVKKLSDVPCGDLFPTCKYIISAKDANKNLETKKKEYSEIEKELSALNVSYKKLFDESIDEQLKDAKTKEQKISVLELEISKLVLENQKYQTKIDNLDQSIKSEESKLDRMKLNLCDENIIEEREKLQTKKKNLVNEISKIQSDITFLSESLGISHSELGQLKREKEEFESRTHKHRALKLLNKALSKNGIPLNIVRKKLPQINAELATILQPITGFTIELESDEESNDMEIFINYGDSRRIIECGSGMEKLMSSIALRTALINVSSLPRPDIFIVDEGFGALEGKSMESCIELLRVITKYFKSIIVISHVDTIKDAVDNIIEIDFKGSDSHVFFD